MKLLQKTITRIGKLDEKAMKKAQDRLDSLTKPPGSLGKLEDLAVKLAGISGEVFNEVGGKVHILMAGDHGVVEEGVSAFPQEVTAAMVRNFLQGGAAINVLSRQAGAEVVVVDMGVKTDFREKDIVDKKISRGTKNMVQGPAMTREEGIAAVEAGIEVVEGVIQKGADLIGTGEMGIGNTTPSTAILGAVTDLSPDEIVGYGTGIDEKRLEHKKEIIKRALAVNRPDADDGIDILHKVGGLEIGGMAGVMLGAAAARKPVIIDGLISAAAALIAQKIAPDTVNFMFPSHCSQEPGQARIYELLNLEPFLDLEMRLGEGTGGILAMNIIEASTRIVAEMATFAGAGIGK